MDLKNFKMGCAPKWEDTATPLSAEDVIAEVVSDSVENPEHANEANWNASLLAHEDLFPTRSSRVKARQEVSVRLFGPGSLWEGKAHVLRKSAGATPVVEGSEKELVVRWQGLDLCRLTGIGGTLLRSGTTSLDHPNPYKNVAKAKQHMMAAEARFQDLCTPRYSVDSTHSL